MSRKISAMNKNCTFEQMVATDENILKPESVIKNPQVGNMINTNERKKRLRGLKHIGRDKEYCYSGREHD